MRKLILFLFFSVWLLVVEKATGQGIYSLKVIMSEKDSLKISQPLNYSESFESESERGAELKQLLARLYDASFLAATFDSVIVDSFAMTAFLNVGETYSWAYLRRGNVPAGLLSDLGFRDGKFPGQPFQKKEYAKLMEKIIGFYENNGFPFASLRLDSVEADSNVISAALHLEKNREITFDTLVLAGDAKISKSYLYNYLGIRPGQPYSEALVKQINQRLQSVPFLKVTKSPEVYFLLTKARIVLFVENRNTDQLDGIVGFAPNSNSADNKLLLTGQVHLKLLNIQGSGKSAEFDWRSFLARSQEMRLRFLYPYLFSTPLGVEFKFQLMKFDTLYLNVNTDFGLQYLVKGNDFFKIYVNNKSTSLIFADTVKVRNTLRLPSTSAISTTLYGINFHKEKLDNRLNPRKGFFLDTDFSAGNKKIRRDSRIERVKFADPSSGELYSVYDSIKLNIIQVSAGYQAGWFLPVKNRSTVLASVSGGHLLSDEIFFNELFRIGGIKTLRGFDEQSIFASTYTILNIEYRYLLQENSYFHAFWNGAHYVNRESEKRASGMTVKDTPYGFGAGLNFETGAGIFSISYALGSQKNNPLLLRSAKVHFGLINYF